MRRKAAAVALLLAAFCFAGDKKPPRQLTPEEVQAAYQVSVNWITARLKAPSTARFAPIEETKFSPAMRNSIDVRLWVDAQNSFGAMLRNAWRCNVGPQRPDGLYKAFCLETRR